MEKANEKILESSAERSDVTHITDITDITNVTHITDPCVTSVTFVTCYTDIPKTIFQENTFEQILMVLATEIKSQEDFFTYDKLSKRLNKDPNNIRQIVNRKKEYFSIKRPDGKNSHLFLSHMAVKEINLRVDAYRRNQEKLKEFEKRKEEKIRIENNFEEVLRSFFVNQKARRSGSLITYDFYDIALFDDLLADKVLAEPQKFIDTAIEYFSTLLTIPNLTITITNIPKSRQIPIEHIRKDHLNSLLCIEGRVTSFGEVKPVITEITYECPSCATIVSVPQNYRTGILQEPSRCACGRRGGFKIVKRHEDNACFVQLEDLQEKTDNPHSQRIKAVLFNELCNHQTISMFTPGNEVKCTGILKEVPIFNKGKKTIFLNWIFEVLFAEKIEKDIDIGMIEQSEKENIDELSTSIDREGLGAINTSFAPDVWGYEEIKNAIILQCCNSRNEKKKKNVRNKSNILLIGDPGVAKSVLGDFAIDVTLGARKAVGGGSSAVGITASVMKEEDSLGGYRVEPGALILAKELLFLDEMNNLSDEDKPKLQEGMNEQTVSINKANIHVQMKVTAGVLAVANPIKGHFVHDQEKPIQEQFNIPTPILNRFDTVFVVRDTESKENDQRIAEKMINRHRGILKPSYDKNFLKTFFSYIRSLPDPIISEETQKILEEVYVKARINPSRGVRINPRFLESLTRMAIASAKIRQSKDVEEKDIIRVLSILAQSQYQINEHLCIPHNKL